MLFHFQLYGELRFSGVMGWRNGLLGLREDDDDDDWGPEHFRGHGQKRHWVIAYNTYNK